MIETNLDNMKMDKKEYVFLFIKSETRLKESKLVYEAFKNYCKLETKDDYTLGLKKLMELAQHDWKEEMLYDLIRDLEERIIQLENKPVEEVKEKDEVAF